MSMFTVKQIKDKLREIKASVSPTHTGAHRLLIDQAGNTCIQGELLLRLGVFDSKLALAFGQRMMDWRTFWQEYSAGNPDMASWNARMAGLNNERTPWHEIIDWALAQPVGETDQQMDPAITEAVEALIKEEVCV